MINQDDFQTIRKTLLFRRETAERLERFALEHGFKQHGLVEKAVTAYLNQQEGKEASGSKT